MSCIPYALGFRRCAGRSKNVSIISMAPVNLVLSGGYVKVVSFVRSLAVLRGSGLLAQVRNIAGTSAGAVLGLLLAAGYSPEEMEAMLLSDDSPLLRMFDHVNLQLDEVLGALTTLGVVDTARFEGVLRDLVLRKLGVESLTFLELSKRVGMNLVVTGSNISRGCLEYFCVDETPDMDVLLAIRISCAVPVLFRPVRFNGDVYVDGAVLNNFPMSAFSSRPDDPQTLGLWIDDPPPPAESGSHGILAHMYDVVRCMIYNQDRNAQFVSGPSVVRVRVPFLNPLDVLVRRVDVRELFAAGETAAREYLTALAASQPDRQI